MRKGLLSTVALAIPFLPACHGLVWGNLAVLAITVGIFMGTISLGRD
ncbi:MAG: hypothetical protein PVI30_24840 [Myxococcales bacterium]|jgi:hypothetical protein